MTYDNHIHQLVRVRMKSVIYRCIHPDCTYSVRREFVYNKRSICNICKEPFIMTRDAMRLAKPHCEKCYRGQRGEKAKEVERLSKIIVGEMEL